MPIRVDSDGNIHFPAADGTRKRREQRGRGDRQGWPGKTAAEAKRRAADGKPLKKYIRLPEVHVTITRMPRPEGRSLRQSLQYRNARSAPSTPTFSDAADRLCGRPEADPTLQKIRSTAGEKRRGEEEGKHPDLRSAHFFVDF